MTKDEFKKFIANNKITVLDGATGTELSKLGMPLSASESQWVCDHKEHAQAVKKAYLDAGSQIIYAPTFSSNREKLKKYGLENDIAMYNALPVQFIKEIAGENVLVAGDMGMTGVMLEPYGDFEYDELVDVYKEQITLLDKAGCDLLVIETIMNLEEMEACLQAASESSSLPVIATMTFEENGRTLYGATPEAAALSMISHGAAAIGANCSTGPDKMLPVIEKMAAVSTVPLVAKPNAGLPVPAPDGGFKYDVDASFFLEDMKKIIAAGASIIGGCCGTTPEYIRLLAQYAGSLR